MKNTTKIMLAAAALCCQQAMAQKGDTAKPKQPVDTTAKYFSRLAASPNEADKALLYTNLYALLKSEKESDWIMAGNYFYQTTRKTYDSLAAAIEAKFPDGQMARNKQVNTVYDAKTAAEKETAYKAWIKKFPPQKFEGSRIQYDYARNAVGTAYAKENNVAKALAYTDSIETPAWKGEGYASTATILSKNDHYAEAGALMLKAVDNSYAFANSRKNEEGAGFAASSYLTYNSMYAEVLYKEKKYAAALPYVKKAHDENKTVKGYINANYANILIANGKDAEAFAILEETLKEGQATEAMKAQMKELYPKVKNNSNYDAYIASLNKEMVAKMLKELPGQMINKPAPAYTLKDVNGKTVSSADLLGKTVVVDFWATWCGPCKASFPAMQMAVEKYKNDTTVKFVFIHTWERGAGDPTEEAKKYIDEKQFPFLVLMDLKDKETGANKVVESFKITGIPTKFVIDKNGNIRFKLTGFSGGNDAAVEEVSAMIALAQKG